MDIKQEKIKLQKLVNEINLTLKDNAIWLHQQDKIQEHLAIYREDICPQEKEKKSKCIKGSLRITPTNKYRVTLTGHKKEHHKNIYDYFKKYYGDPKFHRSNSPYWDFDNFNEIEDIVYCYAGVKKENMEQEFREWLVNQVNQNGIAYTNQNDLIRDLRYTIPNWDEVEHDNLFNEYDINIISVLHHRCSTAGDLNSQSMSVGHGRPMLALRKYKEFLEQRTNPNQQNNEPHTEQENMNKQLLNQILYGPPGTGKTYSTVNYALDILDATNEQKQSIKSIGKLKEEFGSQVEFVTFHQSFSYEDFVEGLKASSDGEKLTYEVEDGVFKQICDNAKDIAIDNNTSYDFDDQSINIWKISLGDTKNPNDDFVYPYCIENNKILLGFGNGEDFVGLNNRQGIADKLNDNEKYSYPPTAINTLKNKINNGDIVIVSHGNTKVKAVGKIIGDYQCLKDNDELNSYVQSREIEWLLVAKEPFSYEKILYKKLSQMSIYGIKKNTKINELKSLLNQDKVTERKSHVLIIDEINRGNISRIFGELITLIEPSKRAGAEEEISVKLPYSKEDFSVPNNLHIIGTMNTADRSLTLIDTALRRRFDFVEMLPDVSLVTDDCEGVDLQAMLKIINQRIEVLYDREHTIGHSFLINVDSLEELQNTFKNKILPLLEEYFYDDWQKIKAVLADKNDSFYKQTEQNDNLFAGMEVDYSQEQKIYNRQDCDKLTKEAFIQIYQSEIDTNQD